MSFESDLAKGIFSIPRCSLCNKISWPPAKFCSNCFGEIRLKRGQFNGKIIAYSSNGDDYFCMVEIEPGLRLLARTRCSPNIGQTVKISSCGIRDGGYFFNVS